MNFNDEANTVTQAGSTRGDTVCGYMHNPSTKSELNLDLSELNTINDIRQQVENCDFIIHKYQRTIQNYRTIIDKKTEEVNRINIQTKRILKLCAHIKAEYSYIDIPRLIDLVQTLNIDLYFNITHEKYITYFYMSIDDLVKFQLDTFYELLDKNIKLLEKYHISITDMQNKIKQTQAKLIEYVKEETDIGEDILSSPRSPRVSGISPRIIESPRSAMLPNSPRSPLNNNSRNRSNSNLSKKNEETKNEPAECTKVSNNTFFLFE